MPCYNPKEIVKNLKKKIRGEQMEEMLPWYKGFNGSIESTQKRNATQNTVIYDMSGVYVIDEEQDDVIEVTELPVQKWTKDYKQYLEKLSEGEKKLIEDIREYHTQNRVHFWIQTSEGVLDEWRRKGLIEKELRLQGQIQTSNLVLFNQQCRLQRYSTTVEIMEEFYTLRLKHYELRKQFQISQLTRDLEILQNQVRFILMIIDGRLVVHRKKKKQLLGELKSAGFVPYSQFTKVKSTKVTQEEAEAKPKVSDDEDEEEDEEELRSQGHIPSSEYNYLLSMKIWNLTEEKVRRLQEQEKSKKQELDILVGTKIEMIWERELDEFLKAFDEMVEEEEAERKKALGKAGGKMQPNLQKKKVPKKPVQEKAGKNENTDSDTDGDSQLKGKNNKKKPSKSSDDESPKKNVTKFYFQLMTLFLVGRQIFE